MASVFILEIRMLRQKEHGSKQEPRLGLCVAHSITMSECEGSTNTWKGGGNCERLHLPELQCQEAMDYACASPRSPLEMRDQMTTSNTVHSPSVRGDS